MKPLFLFSLAFLLLASCAKISLAEIEGRVPVTFTVSQIEQIPFNDARSTRAAVLSDLCTQITVSVFKGSTQVATTNQSSTDAGFGTISFDLAPGTYQVVAIAHNGDGACTISSPDRITFPADKITDTFYSYGTVSITESGTHPLQLARCVTMFRLICTAPVPDEAHQMRFTYTGGSVTFNATTGFGTTNATQSATWNITSQMKGQTNTRYEVYTFPQESLDFINVTATLTDEHGATITTKQFANYPIETDIITQHSEPFFAVTPATVDASTSIAIANDGQWSSVVSR